MASAWMTVRDLHALASARFSSPASRARDAAMLVSDFCGRDRSQVTLRWQLNAVEISIKVFDQKLDGGPGMHDIQTAVDAVCYVHGFKVLAQTQQKNNLVLKLSATIENMDRAFRRARQLPALKSTIQAGATALVVWYFGVALFHGRLRWFLDADEDDAWEVDDEGGSGASVAMT